DVVETLVFYDAPPPAPTPHGSCEFLGGLSAPSNGPTAIGIDLTATGRVPIAGFQSRPGHVSEIRLLVNHIRITRGSRMITARGQLECKLSDSEGQRDVGPPNENGENDHLAILRLVPIAGASVELVADQTSELKIDLDPNRDILVDDEDRDEDRSCKRGE